jgi:hypothetical protein
MDAIAQLELWVLVAPVEGYRTALHGSLLATAVCASWQRTHQLNFRFRRDHAFRFFLSRKSQAPKRWATLSTRPWPDVSALRCPVLQLSGCRHQEGGARGIQCVRRDLGVKYDKAVECLIRDRDALLAFYEFPAEHWKHLRTTNVIESSFATGTPPHRELERMSLEQDRARHDL